MEFHMGFAFVRPNVCKSQVQRSTQVIGHFRPAVTPNGLLEEEYRHVLSHPTIVDGAFNPPRCPCHSVKFSHSMLPYPWPSDIPCHLGRVLVVLLGL